MNTALQPRAGYNQGEQPPLLSSMRYLGQPAVKIGVGDTTLITNSPVVPGPGQGTPRSMGINPVAISGALFNRSGGAMTYDYYLVDDQGNEFLLTPGAAETLADGAEVYTLTTSLSTSGYICLPVSWSLIIRLVTGNPATGQGIIAWPWIHDMARNTIPIVSALTTTELVIGPAEGRGWQLMGNVYGQITAAGYDRDILFYANFDTVVRHVETEIFYLAGEDIVSTLTAGAADIDVAASGVETGFQIDGKLQGLILAYPDKIKITAGENQTTAPLYLFANFAEFDLPRDMGQ